MSSVMPFALNAVELYVVTVNGKHWTCAKEVCKALEYNKKTSKTANIIRARCNRENYAHKYDLTKFVLETNPINWPKDLQKQDIYINEEGIRELVLKSKQPKAADIAEHLGINLRKHKYT